MKEYRIRITGNYDVIVLSPKIIGALIEKIRRSAVKEMVIPAEEILPQGYIEYLSCVLNANEEIANTGMTDAGTADAETAKTELAKALSDGNAYTLIAEQMRKLQCNEQDCFDRVEVAVHERNPRFDMDASEDFYIVTKQENSCFRYVFKGENNEEIGIVLEYSPDSSTENTASASRLLL